MRLAAPLSGGGWGAWVAGLLPSLRPFFVVQPYSAGPTLSLSNPPPRLTLSPLSPCVSSPPPADTMDHLLGAFDRQLSEYTASHFQREGINVQLGTM